MVLLLCVLAGAFVFTKSMRRIVDHGLDVPAALTAQEAERARTEVSLAALARVDALLDEADRASAAGDADAAETTAERADRELAAYPAEADRAAEAAEADLPRRRAAAGAARVADLVLAAAGAALVVVGGVLGFALILG
ncbi:hypothetical protein ACOQFV_04900 [Nocardiopsis changdeensis]|uniref:Uncharacterized protein n=1 Tax=Nocardiopsis changdeensis TaxID=2831969 RepID=A0ABX8BLW6_9ACTN|nr:MULTISPECIES: hypothetical protein [Nocardiopsis]QUX23225.1 hypothetical protein KGD84_02155 [Nocardiopsis changdeensis]QYX39167.1 hypothetical protein K1J57_11605 [Nocardiopsis sp. MT53]